MKPTEPTVRRGPWWLRTNPKAPVMFPNTRLRDQAESAHPHWNRPEKPGRKVVRQQARRAGAFSRRGRR